MDVTTWTLRVILAVTVMGAEAMIEQDGVTASKRLWARLMLRSGYNRHIRPVLNDSDCITVDVAVILKSLVDVDEQNSLVIANMWLFQQWHDSALTWSPADYDSVDEIYVPSQEIWHPEIVLYNNADGVYELKTETKARLHYTGTVTWRVPAIIYASCSFNVRYFPFDRQKCPMEFGSWTYNIKEVKLNHLNYTKPFHLLKPDDSVPVGIDLSVYDYSTEFDLTGAPAEYELRHYAGSCVPFAIWKFNMLLRRKYVFYVVNIIIPLVTHAFLTVLVFYIPSDSKNKIPMAATVLFSLTVFFLLLIEIIPVTSDVMPLLGEYLLFTLVLVIFSLIMTCIALNVHFRSTDSHVMPDWIRKVFLYFLPRLLRMQRPKVENSQDVELKHIKLNWCHFSCTEDLRRRLDRSAPDTTANMYQFGSRRTKTQTELINLSKSLTEENKHRQRNVSKYGIEVSDAMEDAVFIANHLKGDDESNRVVEDWKYIAMVVDRICLIAYLITIFAGTGAIIGMVPGLYDYDAEMRGWMFTNATGWMPPTPWMDPPTPAPVALPPTPAA